MAEEMNRLDTRDFPRDILVVLEDCVGFPDGFRVGFVSIKLSTGAGESKTKYWDPQYDHDGRHSVQTSRDVILTLRSVDDFLTIVLYIDGAAMEANFDAPDFPVFESEEECLLAAGSTTLVFSHPEHSPVSLRLRTEWVGGPARRDLGKFSYKVTADVEQLFYLPDCVRGLITEKSKLYEAFRSYDDDESGELELENVVEVLQDYFGELKTPENTEEANEAAAEARAQMCIDQNSTTVDGSSMSFDDFCRFAYDYKKPVLPSLKAGDLITCSERFVFANGDEFVRIDARQDKNRAGGFVPMFLGVSRKQLLKSKKRQLTLNVAQILISRWYRGLALKWWIQKSRHDFALLGRLWRSRAAQSRYSRALLFAQNVGAMPRRKKKKVEEEEEDKEEEDKEEEKDKEESSEAQPLPTWTLLGEKESSDDGSREAGRLFWVTMVTRGDAAARRIQRWWCHDMVWTGARHWLREKSKVLEIAAPELDKATSFDVISGVIASVYAEIMSNSDIRRFLRPEVLNVLVMKSLEALERIEEKASGDGGGASEAIEKNVLSIKHMLATTVFVLSRTKRESRVKNEIEKRACKAEVVRIRTASIENLLAKLQQLGHTSVELKDIPGYVIGEKKSAAQSSRMEFWNPTGTGSPWYFAYATNLKRTNPRKLFEVDKPLFSFGQAAAPTETVFGTLNRSSTHARRWFSGPSMTAKKRLLESRRAARSKGIKSYETLANQAVDKGQLKEAQNRVAVPTGDLGVAWNRSHRHYREILAALEKAEAPPLYSYSP